MTPRISLFIAALHALVYLGLSLRVVLPLFPEATSQFQTVILLVALASILYGSVMAFTQTNVRLIAGYSSVAQLGFITAGIFALRADGSDGAILQMVNHGLVVAPLFIIVAILVERTGTEDLRSMGGMAILALAEQYPEMFGDRIVGAALISTTAGRLRPHRIISAYIPDSVGSLVGPRLIAGLARAPELVDSARRRGSNIGFLVTDTFAFGDDVPASYVEFVDEMLAGTPFEVLAEFFPHFAALDKFSVLAPFERIPTTIVCGTKDLLTSVGHSRKMAKRIQGARLVEAPGAGPMVILERAERVNTALEQLLEEAETKAGRKAS